MREVNKVKRYEYKCVFILGKWNIERILNEYGEQGWELVCTRWVLHYFKRACE
jgi:hypothetical protein